MDEDTFWFRVWLGLFILLTVIVLLATLTILYIIGINPNQNFIMICIGYIDAVITFTTSILLTAKLAQQLQQTQ